MDAFKEKVWNYYAKHSRTMPWRDAPSFYNVLVSELMLQQTQVSRVTPKFLAFMERFPSIVDVSNAPLSDVIEQWVGLGYNRRAKYLHQACKVVAETGQPQSAASLIALPGVGKNTAAAIMNYVYNQGTPFVETNIRTVYLTEFFEGQADVMDAQILELVAATLDVENPRDWFWALMDYGAHLKSLGQGNITMSKHYKRQSKLAGSLREMRGWIIQALTHGSANEVALKQSFNDDARFETAVSGLIADDLIMRADGILHLTK